jgi:membrane associated rhomboid family serine protease
MRQITDTVKHLIIINIIVFIGCQFIGERAFSLLSIWFPENNNFKIWQVFTHMFMHHPTFYMHILANMFGIFMFGPPLEKIWGRNKFLFFYFSCGLGAVVLPFVIDYIQFNSIIEPIIEQGFSKEEIVNAMNQTGLNPEVKSIIGGQENWDKLQRIFDGNSLGASGALMGLLVGFGMLFPNSELMLIFLPIPIKAKYFIPLVLCYEIYSGIAGGNSVFGVNVAHFAHVGGALTGFIIMLFWKKDQFDKHRWN